MGAPTCRPNPCASIVTKHPWFESRDIIDWICPKILHVTLWPIVDKASILHLSREIHQCRQVMMRRPDHADGHVIIVYAWMC